MNPYGSRVKFMWIRMDSGWRDWICGKNHHAGEESEPDLNVIRHALKTVMKNEGADQLLTVRKQLRLKIFDGKLYKTDVADTEQILRMFKLSSPNLRSFDWLIQTIMQSTQYSLLELGGDSPPSSHAPYSVTRPHDHTSCCASVSSAGAVHTANFFLFFSESMALSVSVFYLAITENRR